VAAVEMPKYLNDRLWNNVIPAIKYISGILGKDPILDLELADQNEYCPTGYEKISLYDWGNVAFCSCITYVEMPKQKTGCGGTSCQKILAQTFWLSIWKDKVFCAKKIPKNYWQFKPSLNCPFNYQECPGNICVDSMEASCPISGIKISKTPMASYESKGQFNDLSTIYISKNKSENSVLVSLIGSVEDFPCINSKNRPVRTGTSQLGYQIEQYEHTGCDSFGKDDISNIQIDSRMEWDFFAENKLYFTLAGQEIPGMKATIEKSQINLYGIFQILNSCPQFDFAKMADDADLFSLTISFRTILDALIFAFTGMWLIEFLVIGIAGFCSASKEILVGRFLRISAVPVGLISAFCIGIGIPTLVYYNETFSSIDQISQIALQSCFQNPFYNAPFLEFQISISEDHSTLRKYMWASIIFGILFASALIYSIYINNCAKKNKEIKTEKVFPENNQNPLPSQDSMKAPTQIEIEAKGPDPS